MGSSDVIPTTLDVEIKTIFSHSDVYQEAIDVFKQLNNVSKIESILKILQDVINNIKGTISSYNSLGQNNESLSPDLSKSFQHSFSNFEFNTENLDSKFI